MYEVSIHYDTSLVPQTYIVIKLLMRNMWMSRHEAMTLWYTSKTKKYLETNKIFGVSGARCYWELTLELTHNPNWLQQDFL